MLRRPLPAQGSAVPDAKQIQGMGLARPIEPVVPGAKTQEPYIPPPPPKSSLAAAKPVSSEKELCSSEAAVSRVDSTVKLNTQVETEHNYFKVRRSDESPTNGVPISQLVLQR